MMVDVMTGGQRPSRRRFVALTGALATTAVAGYAATAAAQEEEGNPDRPPCRGEVPGEANGLEPCDGEDDGDEQEVDAPDDDGDDNEGSGGNEEPAGGGSSPDGNDGGDDDEDSSRNSMQVTGDEAPGFGMLAGVAGLGVAAWRRVQQS